MDFFSQQERARQRSGLLKWYFALAVAGKVICFCLVFGTLFQLLRELRSDVGESDLHILNGDTRLNMELMGLVHGLLWPAIIGRVMVHGACATTAMDDRSIIDPDTVGRIPEILGGYCMAALGLVGVPFVRVVKLARAAPALKRRILLACGLVIAADGRIEVRELEMLRAVADVLDCPIPPFVEALEAV